MKGVGPGGFVVAGDGSRIATVGAGIGLLLAALVNCGRIELSEAGLWAGL
jgi:hypothetical protein